MFKVTSREQLIQMFAELVMKTPHEFIDWENVAFDIGDEYVVDGKSETLYYSGCRPKLVADGSYTVTIPIKRRPSVYAYYADGLDDEIEEARQRLKDLELMREVYATLGRTEVEKDGKEDADSDGHAEGV